MSQFPTIGPLITLCSQGLLTGRLFDLGYYRAPQLMAAALLIVGTFLAAECKEYWQFLLCQGIAIGVCPLCLLGTAHLRGNL